MKSFPSILYFPLLLLILLFQLSCKKYLDKKSDGTLNTPSTLQDLQAILDNNEVLNSSPDMLNTFTDEYFIYETDWNTVNGDNKGAYIWDPAFNNENDWAKIYYAVFYVNTVLDELQKIPSSSSPQKWNDIKGKALFFRAFYFFNLTQLYAKQYDPQTAAVDLGIPLKVTSDFNVVSVRSTVQETYERIIQDLTEATQLLPNNESHKTRPSKLTAYSLLARVYLQINDFQKALENANSSQGIYKTLMDYNEKDPVILNPFKRTNEEIIFYTSTNACLNMYDWIAKVDTSLFKSYSANDLRKVLFFKDLGSGGMAFEGHYTESSYDLFTGIATDEIYLIKAECHARLGQVNEAMSALNALLLTRWKTGKFMPYTATNAHEALEKILEERRKELLNRGVRWADLRRLNKDPRFAIVLQRHFDDGKIHELAPNDNRYVALIPLSVINRSGIPQNER